VDVVDVEFVGRVVVVEPEGADAVPVELVPDVGAALELEVVLLLMEFWKQLAWVVAILVEFDDDVVVALDAGLVPVAFAGPASIWLLFAAGVRDCPLKVKLAFFIVPDSTTLTSIVLFALAVLTFAQMSPLFLTSSTASNPLLEKTRTIWPDVNP